MTGAKYFSDQLAANGGSFLKALGGYNGWQPGMTVVSQSSPAISVVFCNTESIFSRPPLLACAIPRATRRTTLTSRCCIPMIISKALTTMLYSLHQTLNGWLLNRDAYALHLGKYFNLDGC